jgi:hypothetical protein
MAATAGFLYGDSTPSQLRFDYVAFLRDAIDFSVEVLSSDARMATAVHKVTSLSDDTEREITLAEGLAADMDRALAGAMTRAPTSLAARCAARIQKSARELVAAEAEAARTAVIAERARLAQTASQEYAKCAKALETLVLRHQLPDATALTTLKLEGGHYEALVQSHTTYGLEWTVELEVPASHALARVLRIDRVIERLEVEAPEEGGWLHKEVRNRPQRLDRLHLTGLSLHPSETAIRLRAADDGGGPGFDILYRLANEPPRVELVRINEGAPADAPFVVVGDDAAKLQALRDGLAALTGELTQKKSLKQASLGGTPVQKLESPREIVERLMSNIAPTVHEIANRSLSPGELVVKRLLGDNRREEVFVSKKELEQKTESLAPDLRSVFDVLGLWKPNGSPTVHIAAEALPAPHSPEPAKTATPSAVPSARIKVISTPPPPAAAHNPGDGKS